MPPRRISKIDDNYGVLHEIDCHSQDVRAVCGYPQGGLLTASRDNTAKLYQPYNPYNSHSQLYQTQHFTGPTNYVSTICCGKTKSGEIEIYAGSHDMNIYVYTRMSGKPERILSKHTGPVSTLAFRICSDEDVLVSGSWDSVAIIWRDKIPVATLYGHEHAVWSVAFVARSYILTGGADKTIRKWSVSDGQLLGVFQGHRDCVRGLAVINANEFISCSNDTSVILWNIEGEMLRQFEGHENFIYSVCIVRDPIMPGTEPPKDRPYYFVSSSEDGSIRVWDRTRGMVQVIPVNDGTLWSCAPQDNGNFVIGTSNGHATIFSKLFPVLYPTEGHTRGPVRPAPPLTEPKEGTIYPPDENNS